MIKLPTQLRFRVAAAFALAVIPAIPIIAALIISSQAAGASGPRIAGYDSVAAAPTFSQLTPQPPSGRGAVVAVVQRPATMRSSPGGKPIGRVGKHTTFGSPTVLLVTNRAPGWLGVISPTAGNNQTGWIPQSAVTFAQTNWELKVSLSRRQLTVRLGGLIAQRYTVAVGRPSAPTPTGQFAVTDRLSTGDPTGPYGCCILALSASSPHAIQGWGGGNRIAIHSTPDTSSIGQPVSHGCVRLTIAEGRWLLSHIPLGTPTLISS